MSDLTIIVAASTNNVIGINGKLPWKISGDLKRFKELTMGHPIIMGRKTHESIGKPLPGRENIVLSRDPTYHAEGITVHSSLDDAQREIYDRDAFIIGGSQVYNEGIKIANKIELTRVHRVFLEILFSQKLVLKFGKKLKNNLKVNIHLFHMLKDNLKKCTNNTINFIRNIFRSSKTINRSIWSTFNSMPSFWI